MVSKRYVSYLAVFTTKRGEIGLGLAAQREAVRRYGLEPSRRADRGIREVETGKRSERPRAGQKTQGNFAGFEA